MSFYMVFTAFVMAVGKIEITMISIVSRPSR